VRSKFSVGGRCRVMWLHSSLVVGFFQVPDSVAPRPLGNPKVPGQGLVFCGTRVKSGHAHGGVEYRPPIGTNSHAEPGLPVKQGRLALAGRHGTDPSSALLADPLSAPKTCRCAATHQALCC
jgi:hypothetical protein